MFDREIIDLARSVLLGLARRGGSAHTERRSFVPWSYCATPQKSRSPAA